MNDQIKWGEKDFMKTDMTQGKPVKCSWIYDPGIYW